MARDNGPDNAEWVEFQAMLRTPCRQTPDAHAERAVKCAEMADSAIGHGRGFPTGGSPYALQLALMHAQVALALKAVR